MKKRHIAISSIQISDKAKRYVIKVLNSNRLSYGPYTEKFEKIVAKSHKRKYAIFVNSGTSGLQLAIHALKEIYKWKDDDEIIVPAITFIASSNAVIHNNLKPVFVDVEPDYYCIDPSQIESKITKHTRAIMPVHLFGQSANMQQIIKIARKHNLKIIEDSCETMFATYRQKPVGSLGDISVFSTYIAHIISTGVGGIITTNDKKIAETIKSLMFHGRDNIYLKVEDNYTKSKNKLSSLIERRFQFIHTGYSFRNTEMEAAIGLAEAENITLTIKKRQKVGRDITNMLSDFSDFFLAPKVREGSTHVYMLFPIVIRDKRIKRDDLLLYLETNNIETRLFFPLLTQPIYKKMFGAIEKNFPVAKNLVKNGFIIGSHPFINKDDINYLYSLIKNYLTMQNLIK